MGDRDDDDLQILRAQIQSLEDEVARRDVERDAYHRDYSALTTKRESYPEGER